MHRLYHFAEEGVLPFPAMNVNDAVTKSKFDNKYGTRHSLIDGINRATDMLMGGKNVLVCGYGDVGKGCAEAFDGQGARVKVTEADPINALQALMDGYSVVTVDEAIEDADIVITATGNKDIISFEQMLKMKDHALLGNIGHFDNEIDMHSLLHRDDVTRTTIKPQVDEFTFSTGRSIIVLSEGRLLNLGNATGHHHLSCPTLSPIRPLRRSNCSKTKDSTRTRSTVCLRFSTKRWHASTLRLSAVSSPN